MDAFLSLSALFKLYGMNVSIEYKNNIDFVNSEEGFLRSANLISFESLKSSPREIKTNSQACVWFETASSIYSWVSSRLEELNSSRTSDINPSNIYFIDGHFFPFYSQNLSPKSYLSTFS